MLNIYNANNNPFLFVGDIHGCFNEFCHSLITRQIFHCTNVIVCGDFGVGFHKINYYSTMFKKLDKRFSTCGINLYAFRGNHDDPDFFSNETIKQKVLNNINSIHLVDDYDIVKNDDNTILCIGGARSIDKANRWQWDYKAMKKVPQGWWKGENIKDIPNDFEKFIEDNNISINIICSHSAPDFCEPFGKEELNLWAKYDDTLIEDCNNERALLTKIYNQLIEKHPIKYWFYGHFHKSYLLFKDDVRFGGLDMFFDERKIDFYMV